MAAARAALGRSIVAAGGTLLVLGGGTMVVSGVGMALTSLVVNERQKKLLVPCKVCNGLAKVACDVCQGERTLKYVPAKQPLPGARASRCACAQCAGDGSQCCLNCLGEGTTLPSSPDLWLPSEQQA